MTLLIPPAVFDALDRNIAGIHDIGHMDIPIHAIEHNYLNQSALEALREAAVRASPDSVR